jgi:hypothetical protein
MKRELFWAAIECLEEGIPEWSAHYENLHLAIKALKAAGELEVHKGPGEGYEDFWSGRDSVHVKLYAAVYKAQKAQETEEKKK